MKDWIKTFGAVLSFILLIGVIIYAYYTPDTVLNKPLPSAGEVWDGLKENSIQVYNNVFGGVANSGFTLNPDGSSRWAKEGIGSLEWDKFTTQSCSATRYLNITSYLTSQDLDVCIRTDRPLTASQSDAWVWKNTTFTRTEIDAWVNTTINCHEVNASVIGCNEQGYWAYKSVEDSKMDWFNIKNKFIHVSYGGDEFYCLKNVYAFQNQKYELKLDFAFEPIILDDWGKGCNEKFGLVAKRSSESLSDAISLNHFVELDPVYAQYWQNWNGVFSNTEEDVNGNLTLSGTNTFGTFSASGQDCGGVACIWDIIVWAMDDVTKKIISVSSVTEDTGRNISITGTDRPDYSLIGEKVTIGGTAVSLTKIILGYPAETPRATECSIFAGTNNRIGQVAVTDGATCDFSASPVSLSASTSYYLVANGTPTWYVGYDGSAQAYPYVGTYLNWVSYVNLYPDGSLYDEGTGVRVWGIQSIILTGGATESYVGIDVCFSEDNSTFVNCQTNVTSGTDLGNDTAKYVNWTANFIRTGDGSMTSAKVESVNVTYSINQAPYWDTISNTSYSISYEGGYQPIDNMSQFFRDDIDDKTPSNITVSTNNTNIDCMMDTTVNFTLFCNPDSIRKMFIVTLNGTDSTGLSNITSFEVYSNQPPTIPNIDYPEDAVTTDNKTIWLGCSGSTEPDNDIFYYQFYGDTNNPPTTLIQNTTDTQASWTVVTIGTNYWRCRTCDAYGLCSSYNDTRSIAINFDNINWIEDNYTNNQTSTGQYYYEMSVGYNDIRFSDVSASLNISNKTYSLTEDYINASVSRFYTTLFTLEEWELLTNILFWNISLQYKNDTNQYYYNNTYEGSVYVTPSNFTYNDDGNEISYVNFTFKDEDNESILLGSINADFTYSISSIQEVTKIYSYQESGENESYAFAAYPSIETFYTDYDLTYESGGYTPRVLKTDATALTNVTTNQILYLLKTSGGIYTTFQVLNIANQALKNVYVTAARNIGGVWTVVEAKYTDDAGGATFFVNPDYSYQFTFSKAGYDTQTSTITPTQSAYTITMGAVSTVITESYYLGIRYTITPTNDTLNNQTSYNFSFNIESDYYELQEAGFVITDLNKIPLTSNLCSGSVKGCSSSVEYNTGFLNGTVFMDYYWKVNNTWNNGSHYWSVGETGSYKSLVKFMDDFKKLGNTFRSGGVDSRNWRFTKSLISFAIIFLLVAMVSYVSGIYSPLSITSIVLVSTIFLEYTGFLPSPIGAVPYFISITIAMILTYLVIDEMRG